MRKSKFNVDLLKIEGDGEFPCPKCGTLISPDDETEDVYTVLETFIGEDDNLERIVIKCNKCNSLINLEGLVELLDESDSKVEVSEALPESDAGFRTSHIISLSGHNVSTITVEYAQKADVKAFKRLRKLRIGDPFRATIVTEQTEKTEVTREDLQEISKVVKKTFKGIKDKDIYLVEIRNGKKNIIGRLSNISE